MDHSRGVPLLVVLLALFAATQAPRLVVGPAAPVEPAGEERTEAAPLPEPAAGTVAETARPGWTAPLGLYREFLGGRFEKEPGTVAALVEVKGAARAAGYRLESIVALVPDPVDSNLAANFDQAVEALQTAGTDAGYLLDRLWSPWAGDAVKSNLYREVPGVLLFRRQNDRQGRSDPVLLAIYLVGETPKQGVHKHALEAALALAAQLASPAQEPEVPAAAPAQSGAVALAAGPPAAPATAPPALPRAAPLPMDPRAAAAQAAPETAPRPGDPPADTAPGPVVRILGPSFSGSVPSLRRVLLAWRQEPAGGETAGPAARSTGGSTAGATALGPAPAVRFRVVTGSATAPGLEEQFLDIALPFERTVVPDDVLQLCAFRFLEEHLGWEAGKIALLAESDTAYGQQGGRRSGVAGGPRGMDDPCPPAPARRRVVGAAPLLVRFPSGLSSLRSAWEKDEAEGRQSQAKGAPVVVPRASLGLSLSDQSRPVDILPQFSTLSVAAHDLALSNLLGSIWRGGYRYVGILSTDTRDKLFLADRVRRFAPDTVIFTLDNNLLYAHPQYSGALDGTLVFSSFPLHTENESWRSVLGGPDQPFRRQFTSEFEEGIYFAAGKLLGEPVPRPRGWIAAVGSGSLWPIASFPEPTVAFEGSAGRADLQILLIAAILCLLALWLRAVYPSREMLAGTGDPDLPARRLLAFGCAVLAALGGVVAVLGTLPIWASTPWGLRAANWQDRTFETLYLAALAAAYAFLVWSAARATSAPVWPGWRAGATGRRARRIALAWTVAGVLLLPALALLMRSYWMPGGDEFFYLRARNLTSGLSPLLPLLLLGGAFYAWVLMELKRRRLIARQAIEWPLQWRLEPPLEGVRAIAQPVYDLIRRTFPLRGPLGGNRHQAQGGWFYIALAVVVGPPAVMLLRTVQPICETRSYGVFFLVLVIFAFCLAMISFFQFFTLWLDLDRLLQRLDHTRVSRAFNRVADEVAWSPMRAFGWHPSSFKMIALSADRLRPLLAAASRQELREHLDELFRADQAGDLAAETRARGELNRLFSETCRELAEQSARPEAEEFFAVRIVAFLRPVVAHMRNCLAASLVATLFLLFAVRSYAFEPQWFISMGIWAALAIGVAATLWIFVQMDRNASLSAIGGTPAGKVSFDRHFYVNVLTYGAIPLAGIVVTQFPQVAHFVTGWLNPVLRVTGAG